MSWRYHWKAIETTAIAWAIYEKAWRDDESITIEDVDEILFGAAGIGLIWAPELLTLSAVSTTPLIVVEAALVGGLLTSLAIGGVEGGETYIDFITEPSKMPERIAFTADTIYEEIIKPKAREVEIVFDILWHLSKPFRDRRLLPGPYLPF